MLINAKRMAFLGLLLACSIVLLVLGSVLEFNTLFLLAGASFCVGVAIREAGLRLGAGFWLAGVILGILLSPNKLYCITYGAFGLYILLREFFWNWYSKKGCLNKVTFTITKWIIFNIMLIPIVIFFPRLLFQGEWSPLFYGLTLAGGQLVFYLYDMAYGYFQGVIWNKFRNKLD